MIPSHWFRRITLIVFIMEVAGSILWVTGRLPINLVARPATQALGSLVLLFGSYANVPLSACFLAPRPSRDAVFQKRLARIVVTIPGSRPVLLYGHADKEANTVGLLPGYSRIYMTTDLLTSTSGGGMRGVIAYENAHVHKRRTFAMLTYACYFVVSSHLLDDNSFFLATFLLFLGICRYCKYRADTGAAQSVGCEAMLAASRELIMLYLLKSWIRWFSFANAYPTLVMWMRTVGTGRKALL